MWEDGKREQSGLVARHVCDRLSYFVYTNPFVSVLFSSRHSLFSSLLLNLHFHRLFAVFIVVRPLIFVLGFSSSRTAIISFLGLMF